MRIFVTFEHGTHAVDVDIGRTVGEIKKSFQEKFGLNLNNSRNENDTQQMSLIHQGSSLQDEWIYSDLGIAPGTILVCRVIKRTEPALRVFCAHCEEAIEFKESFRVWQTHVSTLRTMIQDSTGIHVSAFRLYSSRGVELFDCHPLKVYGVDTGDTITMEIWRDVRELVKASRANDITDTLQALASFHEAPFLMRYQLQLGLFSAAHFGYHQLATQLIKCGARPNEPVGLHPSRAWCRTSAHPDNTKTPSHEAAQHGRITCLQHFLMFNHSVVICKDANGLTPCNIARRYKQTECFKLLIAEQFRIPTVCGLSTHVYSRVRRWCDRARARARVHKDKTALLLLTNGVVSRTGAIVGQKVEVDGYNGLSHDSSKHSTVKGRVRPPTQGFLPPDGIKSSSSSSSGSSKSGNVQGKHENSNIRADKGQVRNVTAAKTRDRVKSQYRDNTAPTLKGDHGSLRRERVARASVPKTEEYHIRRMSTSDCLTAEKTTREVSTKQCVVSARESRRIRTSAGKSTAENEETKWRYVWKPALDGSQEISDCMDDQEIHGALEGVVHRSGVKHTPRSCATGQRNVTEVTKGYELDKTCKVFDSTKCPPERQGYNDKAEEVVSVDNRNGKSSLPSEGEPVTSSMNQGKCDSLHRFNGTPSANTQVYQRSVDSADKCLRLAIETFPRKSWLGQLQMALVVNTNVCKRRQSDV